ncbi:Starch-binding associating with outer membrane [Mariniphaga anaerophila]|uniref:Starch-binding associating with outer membrane n=1 Tax=Mariniphaga anaerophila TaxID=1484053 RepID=A0A1M4VDJ2_9BACT|nr:RagB/SusD family nutrient uptake outer membrane protein [Mariniphaga anaerophila]SHE66910.1 Starch-binding associating with outer membrane [Mariniphaga anaerophila]
MKKFNIVVFILFISILTGCMDDFLERNPYGTIDENTFFTKAEHADLAAMACYKNLQKLNGHWADAQLELGMTGDFSSAGFKDAQPFYVGSFNPNESNVVKGIWKRAYEGIAVCNNNIAGVTNMDESIIDAEDKNQYLAEMRFIRAFWYFRLVQFYGDVPLRLEPVTDPTNDDVVQMAATSKEKVLTDLVIPDLTFAAKNLPEKWNDAYYNRATVGAAEAYLLEVNVYLGNYDEAITAGQEVLKQGYSLIENPGNVLRVDYEASPEIIFSVAFGNGVETYREYYFGTKEDLGEDGRIMRGDTYSGDYFYPSEEFVDFFQTIDGKSVEEGSEYYDENVTWKNRDPRFDCTFFTEMDEITTTTGEVFQWNPEWLVNKPTGFDIQKRGVWYGDNTWNKRTDIHLMRLPRVYLLMAEAYAQKNDFVNAAKYVEQVRSRARRFALDNSSKYVPEGLAPEQVLPAPAIASVEDAMAAINYEARVEFFAEDCIRYFDLKRWGKLSEEWSRVGNFLWNDKLYNLPIPSDELNANEKITQNHTGWGN